MSKKCNKCGNYVDDTALFCTQCGNKIPIVSDETLKIERVTFEKEQEELNKRLAKMNNIKTTSTNVPNTNHNNQNSPNIANCTDGNIPLNKNITKNNYAYNMQYKMPKAAINNYSQCATLDNTNSIFNIEKIDNKCYIKLPLNLTIILGICIVVLLLIIIVLILL